MSKSTLRRLQLDIEHEDLLKLKEVLKDIPHCELLHSHICLCCEDEPLDRSEHKYVPITLVCGGGVRYVGFHDAYEPIKLISDNVIVWERAAEEKPANE